MSQKCTSADVIACDQAEAVEVLGSIRPLGRATSRSLSGSQTCPASETGLPRLPTHLADETICGTGVCVCSHKLFDLKLPAAAALTLAAG